MWLVLAPMDHSFYGLTLVKYFHKVSPQWCLSIPNHSWSFHSSWQNTTNFTLLYSSLKFCVLFENSIQYTFTIFFNTPQTFHLLSSLTSIQETMHRFSIQKKITSMLLVEFYFSQKYHKGVRTSTSYTTLSTVLNIPTLIKLRKLIVFSSPKFWSLPIILSCSSLCMLQSSILLLSQFMCWLSFYFCDKIAQPK